MKKISIIVGIVIGAILIGTIFFFLIFNGNEDNGEYQPIEEFVPAYQTLIEADSIKSYANTSDEYDIEETVRIINGLEIAQSQSEDFYSFLEYMAKQDYSQVAKDVIDARIKLLPILQKMFKLQKEHDELKSIWPRLGRALGAGVYTLAKNTDVEAAAGIGLAVMTTGGVGVDNFSGGLGINEAKMAAFNKYEADLELKGKLEREIESLKMSYLEYLEYFTPIYMKYMKEWDKLCVNKDRAYFDVYSGRNIDAYNSSYAILQQYPLNREALLLKSLALLKIGIGETESNASMPTNFSVSKEVNLPDSTGSWNEYFIEADIALNDYINQYPDRSAPALVLKGLLSNCIGNSSQALSYFDQAAMEYPRQAAKLSDLLDSYRMRTYLNYTPEGQYLLRLYRSTMEGYGTFSPNFLKAMYYERKGMMEESKNEIFNHFFRRGNQGVYDCLLSDMQFCEDNLYSSFKQLLMEHSYIDIYWGNETKWLGLLDDDSKMKIAIYNRSDLTLENVRIFLCLHYTDMYKDEYDVIKVPAVNKIEPLDVINIGDINLQYENKKFGDITRIRAIAMTDDRICWIDDINYKQSHAADLSKYTYKDKDKKLNKNKEKFLKDFSQDEKSLQKALLSGINVDIFENEEEKESSGWFSFGKTKEIKRYLQINIPRILTLIDPEFSIYKLQESNSISPDMNYLSGSYIGLFFDYEPENDEIIPLYIYSDFVNYKIDIQYNKNKSKIKNIEII